MPDVRDRVQGIINSFEVGRGVVVLRTMLVAVCVAAFLGARVYTGFRGLKSAEAMEYAQLARNLAEGRGFTTRCLRPLDTWYLQLDGRELPSPTAWPDVRHAPLYPGLLATLLRLSRVPMQVTPRTTLYAPELVTIIPLGIALTLLTGLFVFRLALRLFGPYVATMAALGYLLADTIASLALSGTPLPLGAFFVTAAVDFAVRVHDARERRARPAAWLVPFALSTLAAAGATLTLYSLAAVIPAAALIVGAAFLRFRLTAVGLYLAIVAAVLAPWLWRNQTVAHAPFGLAPYATLNNSAAYRAADGVDRDPEPFIRNAWVAITLRHKLLTNLSTTWDRDWRGVGSALFVCLFLVSFLHRFENPSAAMLRWGVAAGLAVLLVEIALLGGDAGTRLNAFYPLMAVTAAAFFFATIDQIEFLDPSWHPVIMWFVLALTATPTVLHTLRGAPQVPYPPYAPALASFAASQVPPDQILVTDIPWATAWYGDHASMLLPADTAAVEKLDRPPLTVGAIYLTTKTSDRPYLSELVNGPYRSWLPLINGRRAQSDTFRFTDALFLPARTHDQLLLAPAERWKSNESQ